MRQIYLLFILVFFAGAAGAQVITGSWYGRADVEVQGSHSNYLTELILKQKGDEVEGIFGYYFKDSYQSFYVRGYYDNKTRQLSIENLPMLHYSSSTRNGIECPMHLQGTLMVSKVQNTLKGYFYTDDKYKYTCPEMRVSMMMDVKENNQDSILHNTVAGKKLWQPSEDDFIVSGKELKVASATITTNPVQAADIKVPVATAQNAPAMNENELARLKAKFEKRTNTYMQDLDIEGDSVRISFYDNGDIDGDSISVFLNHEPILVKQELSSRALNIYVALDQSREVNEISMLAENLGKYPPNTALMVVTDGKHRYEVYLSSSLSQNASVRLRRVK
jgi:hypothetical protein